MFEFSDKASLSAIRLSNSGKKGKLKDVGNGYREVVLGGLDVDNVHNQHYCLTDFAKAMFDTNGRLNIMARNGVLRSEYGHPYPEPGESPQLYMRRFLSINEKAVCAHQRKVWLQTGKDEHGKTVALIMSHTGPCGPYASEMARHLDNPDENAYWSIRSQSDRDYTPEGKMMKSLRMVVGWDYVNIGGIPVANKYDTPTLEDDLGSDFIAEFMGGFTNRDLEDDSKDVVMSEFEFSQSDLVALEAKRNELSAMGVDMEDDGIEETTRMIRTANGWTRCQMNAGRSPIDLIR